MNFYQQLPVLYLPVKRNDCDLRKYRNKATMAEEWVQKFETLQLHAG